MDAAAVQATVARAGELLTSASVHAAGSLPATMPEGEQAINEAFAVAREHQLLAGRDAEQGVALLEPLDLGKQGWMDGPMGRLRGLASGFTSGARTFSPEWYDSSPSMREAVVKFLDPASDPMNVARYTREAAAYGDRYSAAAKLLATPDPSAAAEAALRALGTEVRTELPAHDLLVQADAAMFGLPAEHLSDIGRGARESLAGHLNGWHSPYGSEEKLPFDIAMIQTRNRGWTPQQVERRLVELQGGEDGFMKVLEGPPAKEWAALLLGQLPGHRPRISRVFAMGVDEAVRRTTDTRTALGEMRAQVRIDGGADNAALFDRTTTLVDRLVTMNEKFWVEDAGELRRLLTRLTASTEGAAHDDRLGALVTRARTASVLDMIGERDPLNVALSQAVAATEVRRTITSADDVRTLLGKLPSASLGDWSVQDRMRLGSVLTGVPEELLPREYVGDPSAMRSIGEHLLDGSWKKDDETHVAVERLLDRTRRSVIADPARRNESLHADVVAALRSTPPAQHFLDARTSALLAEAADAGLLTEAARRIAVLPHVADSPRGRMAIAARLTLTPPVVAPDVSSAAARSQIDRALAAVVDTPAGGGTKAYQWVGRAGEHLVGASIRLADASAEYSSEGDTMAAGLATRTANELAGVATDMRRVARTASERDMPQLGQLGRAKATLDTLLGMREMQHDVPGAMATPASI